MAKLIKIKLEVLSDQEKDLYDIFKCRAELPSHAIVKRLLWAPHFTLSRLAMYGPSEIFEFWCKEYIEEFAEYLISRIRKLGIKPAIILEVGAGDGQLSHFLKEEVEKRAPGIAKVIATDWKVIPPQEPIQNYRIITRWPVEKLELTEALKKYSPHFVIFSWMPLDEDYTPAFRRTVSVLEYILIGEVDGAVGKPDTWNSEIYEREGFERIDLDYLSKWQICRTDAPGLLHHSHTVSFRRVTRYNPDKETKMHSLESIKTYFNVEPGQFQFQVIGRAGSTRINPSLRIVFDLDETLGHYTETDSGHEFQVRPGATRLLQDLHTLGHALILWSTGDDAYVKEIVEKAGWASLFSEVYGRSMPAATHKDIRKVEGDVLVENSKSEQRFGDKHGYDVVVVKPFYEATGDSHEDEKWVDEIKDAVSHIESAQPSQNPSKEGNFPPIAKQYLEVKKQNPDAILFFRLGDFYEAFFDEAILISKVLNLTLTYLTVRGNYDRVPICGIPYHAVEKYASKLLDQGYKIAIYEGGVTRVIRDPIDIFKIEAS